MILVKLFLVCRLILPTTPGDGNIYARCEAVITPSAPVTESSAVMEVDFLGPVESGPGERES